MEQYNKGEFLLLVLYLTNKMIFVLIALIVSWNVDHYLGHKSQHFFISWESERDQRVNCSTWFLLQLMKERDGDNGQYRRAFSDSLV